VSRHFVLGTWANADEYNYSGEQLMGHRQGKSVCMDHMLPSGMANLKRYGDPVAEKSKAQPKSKPSAFSQIMLADRNYSRLCSLSEALDLQLDNKELDITDWAAARKNIDKRLAAGWSRVCKERSWQEESLDNHLDDALSFNLDDIQKAPKRPSKQRNTGWVVVDELSEENTFKALFWHVKRGMMMVSKVVATFKQVIDTIKQEF